MEIKNIKKNFSPYLPQAEIDILLSFAIKKDKVFLHTHPEEKISESAISRFKKLAKKRLSGEPIAYLLGRKEFYGNIFNVNKHVLVPRPETELIIEIVLPLLKNSQKNITVIDVGTGSGCIIITLAKLTDGQDKKQKIKFFGTDISEKALVVARQNARRHKMGKKINFLQGNLLQPLFDSSINQKYLKNPQIIIANLPYLTSQQIKNSPDIKKEPRLSLFGGQDGLKYYRQMFKQISQIKKIYKSDYLVLSEIDPAQKNIFEKLIRKELPDCSVKIKKDLKGHHRLAIVAANSADKSSAINFAGNFGK
jgi:release factor glutamine methyltransferase